MALHRRHRGVASLAVVSVLLLLITVGVLYLTQNQVAEQRAAAVAGNRVAAQEAAEAGLTWGQQMLNRPEPLDGACAPTAAAGNTSFRRRYVQPAGPTADLAPVTLFPGCKLTATGLRCNCPSSSPGGSTAPGSPSSPADAAFSLVFSPVREADGTLVPDAVRLTATGCSPFQGACQPGIRSSADGPDAVSQASVIVKLQPLVRNRPAATLTCGGDCRVSSSVRIINRDTNTNGVLINSGGRIDGCTFGSCLPLQGTPVLDALRPDDSTLSATRTQDNNCSGSVLFRRFFFQSVDDFAGSPGVRQLNSCADGAACAQQVSAALAQGFRALVLPPDFVIDGSQGALLGSTSDPVVLVAQGALRLSGGVTVHGMVFSNDRNARNLDIDNATVLGAVVTCGPLTLNKGATLNYSPQTMSSLLKSPQIFRRLAGSWTDLCSANAAGTVTCR